MCRVHIVKESLRKSSWSFYRIHYLYQNTWCSFWWRHVLSKQKIVFSSHVVMSPICSHWVSFRIALTFCINVTSKTCSVILATFSKLVFSKQGVNIWVIMVDSLSTNRYFRVRCPSVKDSSCVEEFVTRKCFFLCIFYWRNLLALSFHIHPSLGNW